MLKHCAISVIAVALSTSAFGQAKFSAEQGLLTWSSMSSESKVSGVTVKSTDTTLNTMPAGLRLGASWDKFSVYSDPVMAASPMGAPIDVGYWAMDNLEVGLSIDLNSTTGKVGDAKSNSASNNFGVWGKYYMPMGSAAVEAGFGFMSMSKTGKTTPATGPEVKTNEIGTKIEIGADYVMPLAKNLSWISGFSYTMMTGEDKESKVKTTGSNIGLNIATTRWTW